MAETPNPKIMFDLEGYRAELERQEQKLRGMLNSDYAASMPTSFLVTNGRESGLVFAKSLLEKYTVEVTDRKPS